MVRTTEAIFANGVLKPVETLNFHEGQRVRITVEEVEGPAETIDREVAVKRMVEGFKKMRLRTNGRMPTREELHERD